MRMQWPEDVREIPEGWRMEAMRALMAIKEDPADPKGYRTTVLGPARYVLGDILDGMLSVSFGSGQVYEDSFRIVYRIQEDGEPEILAVGQRTGSKVYHKAASRLKPAIPRRRIRPGGKIGRER